MIVCWSVIILFIQHGLRKDHVCKDNYYRKMVNNIFIPPLSVLSPFAFGFPLMILL